LSNSRYRGYAVIGENCSHHIGEGRIERLSMQSGTFLAYSVSRLTAFKRIGWP
jgi:hypothetical protein